MVLPTSRTAVTPGRRAHLRLPQFGLVGALLTLAGCGGFDRDSWIAERGKYEENRRGGMVSALEDAGIKPGMAKADVRRLLGDPDVAEADRDEYYLGRSPYGADYESYRLIYDREGRVLGASVTRT